MNNKKFLKISIVIAVVFALFIMVNKLLFKDRVHLDDYINRNEREVEVTYDSIFEDYEGTFIKFKIKNNSKFIYRIQDMYIDIQSIIKHNDGSESWYSMLKIDLYNGREDENWDLTRKGIASFEEGYVEFLIPKGIKLDEEYFNLNGLEISCTGSLTMNIPFSDSAYVTFGSIGGSYTIDREIKDLLTGK